MSSMQRTPLLSKLMVAWLGCAALTAAYAADIVDPDKRDALAWLKAIQAAAQKQNYIGTFVFQQANQVRTSRVTHVLDGKTELEKLEILDGRPREYIRVNDEVACYVPEIRTVIKEKRSSPESFPAMIAAHPADLSEHYDINKGEMAATIARPSCSNPRMPCAMVIACAASVSAVCCWAHKPSIARARCWSRSVSPRS